MSSGRLAHWQNGYSEKAENQVSRKHRYFVGIDRVSPSKIRFGAYHPLWLSCSRSSWQCEARSGIKRRSLKRGCGNVAVVSNNCWPVRRGRYRSCGGWCTRGSWRWARWRRQHSIGSRAGNPWRLSSFATRHAISAARLDCSCGVGIGHGPIFSRCRIASVCGATTFSYGRTDGRNYLDPSLASFGSCRTC
jgi:hypothetical protein